MDYNKLDQANALAAKIVNVENLIDILSSGYTASIQINFEDVSNTTIKGLTGKKVTDFISVYKKELEGELDSLNKTFENL